MIYLELSLVVFIITEVPLAYVSMINLVTEWVMWIIWVELVISWLSDFIRWITILTSSQNSMLYLGWISCINYIMLLVLLL